MCVDSVVCSACAHSVCVCGCVYGGGGGGVCSVCVVCVCVLCVVCVCA